MDRQILRKFAKQHLDKCSKLTMMENRKQVAAKGLLRERHADEKHHLVKERAKVFEKKRKKLEKQTGHSLCMVNVRYGGRATTITCSTCTSTFEMVGAIARGTCKGTGFRKPLLRLKRKMMAKIHLQDSEGLQRLWEAWELSSEERSFAANLVSKQQD